MEARTRPKKNERVRVSWVRSRCSRILERERIAINIPANKGMRNLKGIIWKASFIFSWRRSFGTSLVTVLIDLISV